MTPPPSCAGDGAHGAGGGARSSGVTRAPGAVPGPQSGRRARWRGAGLGQGEKDAKLAQKLGQLQPFIAVFPPECTGQPCIMWANLHRLGQLASCGPTCIVWANLHRLGHSNTNPFARKAAQGLAEGEVFTALEQTQVGGSVALSLCTTAHPLHTRFTKIIGTSISEATMRPNAGRRALARADVAGLGEPHRGERPAAVRRGGGGAALHAERAGAAAAGRGRPSAAESFLRAPAQCRSRITEGMHRAAQE